MIQSNSLLFTCFLLALCTTKFVLSQDQPAGEVPDASGCAECKTRYIQWLTSKNINATYWQEHTDAKSAADELCSEADDIYNNCFMVCITDSLGNTHPHTEDRNAQALEIFLRESCHNHACRLADTLACSRGAGRSNCLAESRECYLSQLTSNGCTPVLPCVPAERQAFISMVKGSADCFLGYPDLVADGVPAEDERRLGLQVCKDVILSGCLSSWSNDAGKQDFVKFVSLEVDFQNQICGTNASLSTLDCIESAINGTVTYGGNEYEKPCDPLLMTEEATEILQSSVRDILLTYDFICSANASDLCKRKDEFFQGAEGSNQSDSEAEDEFPDSPPPVDEMDMAEGDEDKPMESTEPDQTDDIDHSDHDHEDMDHDMTDGKSDTKTADSDEVPPKEGDKDHDHKHPGPIGKSSDDNKNNAMISRSSICGFALLLLLTLCVQ